MNSDSDKKEKGMYIFAAVSGLIVLTAAVLSVYLFVFRMVPRLSVYTIELGDKVPDECTYYMTGADFMFRDAEPDISEVDNLRSGEYPVYLTVNGRDYIFEVEITDTTAPELVWNSEGYDSSGSFEGSDSSENSDEDTHFYVLELGQAYTVDDFFSEKNELSENLYIDLYVNDNFASNVYSSDDGTEDGFCFDFAGNYSVMFEASDKDDNSSCYFADFTVVDTTAPTISLIDTGSYFKTGEKYEVSDFAEIADASGTETSYFLLDGIRSDWVSFSEAGDYELSIGASDASGNEASYSVTISFDDAPIFIAVHDMYISEGSDFNPYSYIAAVDSRDGNLSDSIIVDKGDFDQDRQGTYIFTYYVTDSCGLTTVATENITVGEVEDTSYELTDDEFYYLTEYDYFSYEPLENADFGTAFDLVTPTLVNLKYNYANYGYVAGSGFIYRIDEDYIYMVSCEHVVSSMNGNVDLMFCDESAYVASESVQDSVAMGSDMECAMFRIPVRNIPYNVLLQIRQVYENDNIYNELEFGQELFAYSGHYINGKSKFIVVYLKEMDAYFDSSAQHCIVTDHELVHGMSGCPLFDEYGNLVGVSEGYMGVYNYISGRYEYTDYFMMVDRLEDMYESLKGQNADSENTDTEEAGDGNGQLAG